MYILAGVGVAAADEDPWFAGGVAEPVAEERTIERGVTERPQAVKESAPGGGGVTAGWVRTTLSLGAVVTLIVVLGYLSRKFPIMKRGRGAGVIEVISRMPLSAKQTLCLVRIGPRMILIGAAGDRLCRLDVIDDAELTAQLAGRAHQATAGSTTRAFGESLSDEEVRYAIDVRSQPDAASEPRMIDIKNRLAGTIQRLKSRRSA